MRCAQCGAEISPKHPRGPFCGAACRMDAWYPQRDMKLGDAGDDAAPSGRRGAGAPAGVGTAEGEAPVSPEPSSHEPIVHSRHTD